MKRILIFAAISSLLLVCSSLYAQDKIPEKLGLPGDNFNLFAALKLFQETPTLDAFERKLNEKDSRINNLDLDGDGKTDYIKVIDHMDGDAHNIVLQVAINEKDNQDVAVFTVNRENKNKVNIQVTGDEDLYGKNYIIEPNTETSENTETPNPGYTGNQPVVINHYTDHEIASWPIVIYVYQPDYFPWNSPWHWSYYPDYWAPWQPWFYDYYYGYHYNWNYYYYSNFHYGNFHRWQLWNDRYYHGWRSYSPIVRQRRERGFYGSTYTRPELRKEGINLFKETNPGRPVFESVPKNNNHPGFKRPVDKPTNAPGIIRPKDKPVELTPMPKAENPIHQQPHVRPVEGQAPGNPSPKPSNPKQGLPPTRPVENQAPVDASPKQSNPNHQQPHIRPTDASAPTNQQPKFMNPRPQQPPVKPMQQENTPRGNRPVNKERDQRN